MTKNTGSKGMGMVAIIVFVSTIVAIGGFVGYKLLSGADRPLDDFVLENNKCQQICKENNEPGGRKKTEVGCMANEKEIGGCCCGLPLGVSEETDGTVSNGFGQFWCDGTYLRGTDITAEITNYEGMEVCHVSFPSGLENYYTKEAYDSVFKSGDQWVVFGTPKEGFTMHSGNDGNCKIITCSLTAETCKSWTPLSGKSCLDQVINPSL